MKIKKNLKAQIAMEFIFLSLLGFFILFTVIIALGTFAAQKTTEKTNIEAEDLGRSLQQELIISADLEEGYQRKFFIPDNINNKNISVNNGITSKNTGYITISYENRELYYEVPPLTGTIQIGTNTIKKSNDTLYIN